MKILKMGIKKRRKTQLTLPTPPTAMEILYKIVIRNRTENYLWRWVLLLTAADSLFSMMTLAIIGLTFWQDVIHVCIHLHFHLKKNLIVFDGFSSECGLILKNFWHHERSPWVIPLPGKREMHPGRSALEPMATKWQLDSLEEMLFPTEPDRVRNETLHQHPECARTRAGEMVLKSWRIVGKPWSWPLLLQSPWDHLSSTSPSILLRISPVGVLNPTREDQSGFNSKFLQLSERKCKLSLLSHSILTLKLSRVTMVIITHDLLWNTVHTPYQLLLQQPTK